MHSSTPNITTFGKRKKVKLSKTDDDIKERMGRRMHPMMKGLPIMCQVLYSVPSTTKFKTKVRRLVRWLNGLEHLPGLFPGTQSQ